MPPQSFVDYVKGKDYISEKRDGDVKLICGCCRKTFSLEYERYRRLFRKFDDWLSAGVILSFNEPVDEVYRFFLNFEVVDAPYDVEFVRKLAFTLRDIINKCFDKEFPFIVSAFFTNHRTGIRISWPKLIVNKSVAFVISGKIIQYLEYRNYPNLFGCDTSWRDLILNSLKIEELRLIRNLEYLDNDRYTKSSGYDVKWGFEYVKGREIKTRKVGLIEQFRMCSIIASPRAVVCEPVVGVFDNSYLYDIFFRDNMIKQYNMLQNMDVMMKRMEKELKRKRTEKKDDIEVDRKRRKVDKAVDTSSICTPALDTTGVVPLSPSSMVTNVTGMWDTIFETP